MFYFHHYLYFSDFFACITFIIRNLKKYLRKVKKEIDSAFQRVLSQHRIHSSLSASSAIISKDLGCVEKG